MAEKWEKSIAANSNKEGDNNGFPKSAIVTNHLLSNQFMSLSVILKKTLFSLPNISGANTLLPIEPFSNSTNEEDIPELLNILQDNNMTD